MSWMLFTGKLLSTISTVCNNITLHQITSIMPWILCLPASTRVTLITAGCFLLILLQTCKEGQVEKQDTSGNERERECESESVDY